MKCPFFNFKKVFSGFCKQKQKYFSINKVHNNYFILRHGHTDYTVNLTDIIYPTSTHFELGVTDEGKEDIKKLIPSVKEKKINLIFASDYLRAQITAKIIAEALDIKIISDKRLRDVNLGIYEGGKKQKYYADINPKKMFEEGPEGGESWIDCINRVESLIKDIEKQYQNKNILIVGHGDPLWLLEKGIAQKDNIDKLLEERFSIPIINPGELRTITFK